MCVNEAILLKLIAGDLSNTERDKVSGHLAQCDACQRLHRSRQAAWDDLGEWDAASALPSRDLTGAVLAAAGSSMGRVVKTTVFITNMDEFQKMNAVYAEFFPTPPPARSTVQVSRLPKDACVEIEVVATV